MTRVEDVVALAEEVMRDPRRGAIGANVTEVAALAAAFLDLWEVALGAEALIRSETLKEATILAGGITQRLADLRGEPINEAHHP